MMVQFAQFTFLPRPAVLIAAVLSLAATAALAMSFDQITGDRAPGDRAPGDQALLSSVLVQPSERALTVRERMSQISLADVRPPSAAPLRRIDGITFVPGS